MIKHRKGNTPYITQNGKDYEPTIGTCDTDFLNEYCANIRGQYVANFRDGCVAGFKYFDLSKTKGIKVNLMGRGNGFVIVRTSEDGEALLNIPVQSANRKEILTYQGILSNKLTDKEAIYISYEGKGRFDFLSFELF